MIIRHAKVYHEDGYFSEQDLCFNGSFLCENSVETDPSEEILDASGLIAIPGLVDMHFHGCMGHDFCEGTDKAIQAITNYEYSQGVLSLCPATMTLPEETLVTICQNAASHQDLLCGINLEGPFLSKAKKGAQNEAFLCPPDIQMFKQLKEVSKDLVKTVAIAPEEPGALDFIEQLKLDTVISIAHTAADYDIALAAFKAGARHVTHAYNAMAPFSHRAPGVIGAACDHEDCRIELICDGLHIHPATVRATFKMFGADRIILISDSMEATGMPDGEYALGGQPVYVKGNRAELKDGTIAGSATNLMDCLRIAVKQMGISLTDAVKCATVNPAKEIGIFDRNGSLAPGKYADIVLLNEQLEIQAIYRRGEKI